jgi:ribose 5-phosphate isomerase B
MSIAANKIKGIRAALCADCYSAKMAKQHNNANVITLGARTLGVELAWEIVLSYLFASFLGGIHEPRVKKIDGMIS